VRIGKTKALFKPRADMGQPVMSAVCRVPRARRKALGVRGAGAAPKPFSIISTIILISWPSKITIKWTRE
jgi:hypothetical protein